MQSPRTASVAVVFLDDLEITRHSILFEPRLEPLDPLVTGASGQALLSTDSLEVGRYLVELRYEGDLDRWPSHTSLLVDLPPS